MRDSDVQEHVLGLIREEREFQTRQYGTNADLELGFGDGKGWLYPYSGDAAPLTEALFRSDYVRYEDENGQPTWMHLIREEVAELFETEERDHTVEEAVQVAALCVSLVENLLRDDSDVSAK